MPLHTRGVDHAAMGGDDPLGDGQSEPTAASLWIASERVATEEILETLGRNAGTVIDDIDRKHPVMNGGIHSHNAVGGTRTEGIGDEVANGLCDSISIDVHRVLCNRAVDLQMETCGVRRRGEEGTQRLEYFPQACRMAVEDESPRFERHQHEHVTDEPCAPTGGTIDDISQLVYVTAPSLKSVGAGTDRQQRRAQIVRDDCQYLITALAVGVRHPLPLQRWRLDEALALSPVRSNVLLDLLTPLHGTSDCITCRL